MDQLRESSLPTIDDSGMRSLVDGYESALTRMTPAQLMSQLERLNEAIAQSPSPHAQVTELLLRKLESESQPLARSSRMALPIPPSAERGALTSPPSPESAVDLLASKARLARRVAGKLVLAQARAQSRKR